MKRRLTRFALTLGLALVMLAPALAGAATPEETVTALDAAWAKAYLGCDAKTWEGLLADDLTFIHMGGNMDDKAKQLAAVKMCNMASLKSQVTKATAYGPNTVVVLGNMQGGLKGSTFTFDLLYSRVYIRQGNAWKLVAHQSTGAPKPAK